MRLLSNYLAYSITLFVTFILLAPNTSEAVYCSDCFSWDCGCDSPSSEEVISYVDPLQYQNKNNECCGRKDNETSCDQNCCFWGYFDLLHWKVLQGETDFVVTKVPTSTSINGGNVGQIGDIENTEFEWATGFRLGGVVCLDCNWDLELNYTNYSASGCKVINAKDGCYLNATFEEINDTVLTKAKSDISLDYRLWNLLAAKKIYVDPCLDMRLTMGLTCVRLDQDWDFSYYGGSRNDYELSWRYSGVGIRGGVDAVWAYCGNWSFIGKFSTALFCGDYKNKGKMIVSNGTQTSAANGYDYKLSDCRLVPHYQLAIGPQYTVDCWGWPITAYALYELNAYQNIHYVFQSEFGVPSDAKESRHTNSLTGFHGVTLGLFFEF
ncbi:MAG: Lpg1974 family pore-forming outer membrane protein [Chlamydiota bacterium]|nr:Lpg1974 family pore-forming outer membrane protein [Chlamydiota bacterium]